MSNQLDIFGFDVNQLEEVKIDNPSTLSEVFNNIAAEMVFCLKQSVQKENLTFKNEKPNIISNQKIKYNDLSFVESVSMKINSHFTFENFVVGQSNQMPFAASKRICEKNSLIYNPLYIHGDVGMGKTHLLSAIAIDMKKNLPNLVN